MLRSLLIGVAISLSATVFCIAESRGERPISLHPEDFICFPINSRNSATKVKVGQKNVTFTRIISGSDAGCEYRPNGNEIPLDKAHGRIEVQPIKSINRGYYAITITFIGEDGKWDDQDWIGDFGEPRSTKLLILPDVREFAKKRGVSGMNRYYLKIRVQPQTFGGQSPAFVFSKISIGPVK